MPGGQIDGCSCGSGNDTASRYEPVSSGADSVLEECCTLDDRGSTHNQNRSKLRLRHHSVCHRPGR